MDTRRSALLPTWPTSSAPPTPPCNTSPSQTPPPCGCYARHWTLPPPPHRRRRARTHDAGQQQRPQRAAAPFPHVRSVGLRGRLPGERPLPGRPALHAMLMHRTDAGASVAVVRVAPSPNHALLSSVMRLGSYHDAAAFELAHEVRPTAALDAFERSRCLRMGKCNQDDGWRGRRARARSFEGRTRFQM